MPVNMDELDDVLDESMEAAAGRTDLYLSMKIAEKTRLTPDEIRRLCPAPADMDRLDRLVAIVREEGDRRARARRFAEGAEDFGGIALELLRKVL